jgi:hypothetical protein
MNAKEKDYQILSKVDFPKRNKVKISTDLTHKQF